MSEKIKSTTRHLKLSYISILTNLLQILPVLFSMYDPFQVKVIHYITIIFFMKNMSKQLLLQSQFTVADTLVSLAHLKLVRLFNFLDIFQKYCNVIIFSNSNICYSFVKIHDLMSFIHELAKIQ